jgi:hypothetical protein
MATMTSETWLESELLAKIIPSSRNFFGGRAGGGGGSGGEFDFHYNYSASFDADSVDFSTLTDELELAIDYMLAKHGLLDGAPSTSRATQGTARGTMLSRVGRQFTIEDRRMTFELTISPTRPGDSKYLITVTTDEWSLR